MKGVSTIFIKFISILSLLFFSACESNENLLTNNPIDGNVLILLKQKAFEGNSWKEVDKIYKQELAKYSNDEVINLTILYLSNDQLRFFDDADIKTYEYYLAEARKVGFNRNLRLIVKMLDKVEHKWSSERISNYAKEMYDKNVNFWNSNFTGQTIYLEKNAEALNALLAYQKPSNFKYN